MKADKSLATYRQLRTQPLWRLLAAATGLAFASWIDKGAGIFMATVEAGLAWCF